ncbi:DUF1501 domain-containing protein [Isosphaeraceae bacterium EP7]
MLRFLGPSSRLCDGLTRREILRVGGLGLLGSGLNIADLARAGVAGGRASAGSTFGRARSCIALFLMGGVPQHSTWDPKPDAPEQIRGEFRPIATKVPGLSLSELMPRTAAVADKLCILRAMSTGDNAHSSSGYYMLTGQPHNPKNFENANPGAPNDAPVLGALVGRLAPPLGGLPSAVTLPHRIFNTDGSIWPGQDAGFLGRSSDPWLLNAVPTAEGYQIREINLPADLDPARLGRRKSLLDEVNAFSQGLGAKSMEGLTRQALDLLSSAQARRAFQLDDEPRESRDRYGASPFGQGVLLARRLVEAGVRLAQVNWYRAADEPQANPCWDSHENEAGRLKTVLMPPTDQAYSALLEDLDRRGLLDETLVVCMSEFGRTPNLDARGGRGHWGTVFSVSLAGGGVRGGQVYGASDKIGGDPRDGLVRPEDLAATIFHCLGYSPDTEYQDPLGRPHPISRGTVLHAIL